MRTARLFLVVAAVLWCLPTRWSLWTDEFYTAGLVGRPLLDVIESAANDRHPPGYYLGVWLLGFVTRGDDGLRLASGLAVCGALAVTLSAARRHFDSGTAAAVTAWFACSAVPFTFAHTMRMYGQSALAGAILLWGALEATVDDDRRARRGIAALALGATLAFYTHYAAALVAIPAFLGAGIAAASAGRWRRVGEGVLAGVVVAGLALPWALGPLQAQLAERNPHGAHAWEVLGYLLWNARKTVHPLSWVALAAAAVGVGLTFHRHRARGVGLVLLTFAAASLVLPVFASSNLPARLPRNYIGYFPVAALFAGLTIHTLAARLWARESELLGGGLAALCTLPLTLITYGDPAHPQDIGGGHDYRLEAHILRAMIPTDTTLTFNPGYSVAQMSRYVPSLATQVAPNGEWTLRAGGGGTSRCDVIQAFRHRVHLPDRDCDAGLRVLAEAARSTGYGPALLEIAQREIDAGNLDEAEALLEQAREWPVRGPLADYTAAQLAAARKQPEAELAAYEAAVAAARAEERAGKAIAGLWGRIAGLRRRLGDPQGAEAAAEAQACAQTRVPAWACGGPLAALTRDAALDDAEE